jgi:hypothetical protein
MAINGTYDNDKIIVFIYPNDSEILWGMLFRPNGRVVVIVSVPGVLVRRGPGE